MKTTTFRIWKTNRQMLDIIKKGLEGKRGQVLSRNLVLNEALKKLIEEEGLSNE